MDKKLKNIVKAMLVGGHRVTALLDAPFMRQNIEMAYAPVFILGPPRTGTTLLYQLLTCAFSFAYLPNIANTFYQCPIFATRLGRHWLGAYKSEFQSRYGKIAGWMAPSEAGNVWNRWFPSESREGFHYTPAGFLSLEQQREVYRLVAQIERLFGAPFITKNVKMSVRLPAIHEVFPHARFIRIRRNPVDAAASILKIRRESGRYWWSVMPRDMDDLRHRPDIEQVALQVYNVEKDITRDIRLFNENQILEVHYQALCQSPQQLVEQVAVFLDRKPDPTGVSMLPKQFTPSKIRPGNWITSAEMEQIEALFEKLLKAEPTS